MTVKLTEQHAVDEKVQSGKCKDVASLLPTSSKPYDYHFYCSGRKEFSGSINKLTKRNKSALTNLYFHLFFRSFARFFLSLSLSLLFLPATNDLKQQADANDCLQISRSFLFFYPSRQSQARFEKKKPLVH
jgi:hypothetical protein